jgi:hypothetical protein
MKDDGVLHFALCYKKLLYSCIKERQIITLESYFHVFHCGFGQISE